ncbi:MAG: CRISPR-associated endonuclease Cas1 [Promethearchaeota archaeon]
MDVILETPGTRVGKEKEMLKLTVPSKKPILIPLREVESIIVNQGIQISTQALRALSYNAINIIYTSMGKPFGIYTPFVNLGTIHTRRQQILAYEDWRGCHLASRFVYSTIENKRKLLLYFAKNRKESNPGKYKMLRAAAKKIGKIEKQLLNFSKYEMKGKRLSEVRSTLMGMEGKSTAIYFLNYGNLFPDGFKVLKRTRRPPRDPINSLLSLGYTVLQGYVTTAIAAAGLELYGGYLHSDRSGKPSLALDLLEEFRQPVVDRLVAKLIFKEIFKPEDFESSFQGHKLKNEKKEIFYKKLKEEVLGGSHAQTLFGENEKAKSSSSRSKKKVNLNYKAEMIRQARKVANFLLGKTKQYEPFIMNW